MRRERAGLQTSSLSCRLEPHSFSDAQERLLVFKDDCQLLDLPEEVSSANFIAIVQKCQSGIHLYNEIQTLPNSGSKLGVSLTMNRGIKALATLKKIDAETGNVTWGKCKKNLRVKLVNAFRAVVPVEPLSWRRTAL